MAQRFVCGSTHTYPSANVGRWFHRFLVEWLTRVVGWALVDKSTTGNWDNVAASGSGTCSTLTSSTIRIDTAGSYAFTVAAEGGFLTLTGFSAPNEKRDGIYKIKRYLGNPSTNNYDLEIDTDIGVHSDGVPVAASGVSWRLWFGNDSYCPTTLNTHWAVVAGTGTTGAGMTNATGSADTLAASGGTVTLTKADGTFQSSDVGKNITVAGATTGGHNGTFAITARLSATQVQWANAAGGLPASEAFPGTWTIRYTYHVWFTAQNATMTGGFGEMKLSPGGTWDAVAHAWKNAGAGVTSSLHTGGLYGDTTQACIFAEADNDHFYVWCKNVPLPQSGYHYYMLWSAAELDSFYPDTDPRPCYLWAGGSSGAYYDMGAGIKIPPLLGYLSESGNYQAGIRALALDDLTTVTCYAMVPAVMPSSDYNPIHGFRKKIISRPGGGFYKIPIIIECRTANYMELRGTMRQAWHCSSGLPVFYQQGASGEYVCMHRSILVPWNNSRSAVPETGWMAAGG